MYLHTLNWFSQPVAFYAYTSWVDAQIIEVDAVQDLIFGKNTLSDDDKEIIELIDRLFAKADKLNRRNDYCSTRRDNKTVIEMSDNCGHHIFFGRYDHRYYVGLSAHSEYKKCRIDLLDVLPQEWSKL